MIGESFDALICDLDGVVYRGDDAISGAAEALDRLRARGTRVLFCTNNSRPTRGELVEKLNRLGVRASEEDLVSSATVTAETLQERGFAGRTAIVVGGPGIREALDSVCISVKDDPAVTKADLVVVGWDTSFTFDTMRRAARAVLDGATFVATNDDAAYPAPDGLWPGTGAILASIERASGASAEVMGKPHRPMLESLARRLEGLGSVAVVGDRAETDLAGARAMGWTAILVTSGVTAAGEEHSVEPAPDLVLGSLAEIA